MRTRFSALSHRPFEDIADTELAADLLHVDCPALVREGRIAGDDEEPADAGKRGDDLLDHAVGEVFLLGIAAHIGEGQHRDRRLVGKCQRWRRSIRCRRFAEPHSVHPQRAGDVFEALLAEIIEGDIDLAGRICSHPAGNADAAGLGQPFEPSREVDSIAENVAVLDDDVALVDAKAKLDPLFGWRARVPVRHRPLHLDGAAHGIDNALELD